MKKVLAIAFFAAVAVSCSKKEKVQQDSNVMLEEPKVELTDSAAVTKPADQTTVAQVKDSAAVKK